MTNNSPFDDHIKKRLGNYEPEVPSHIWENIIASKEKRRPGGFLFNLTGTRLTVVLLVLVLSAGGALLVHNYNNSLEKSTPVNESFDPAKTATNDQNSIVKHINPEEASGKNDQEDHLNRNTVPVPEKNINSNDSRSDDPRLADKPSNKKNNTDPAAAILSGITTQNNTKKTGIRSDGDQQTQAASVAKSSNKIKSSSKTRVNIDEPGTESIPETKEMADAAKNSMSNNELSLQKYYLDLNPFPVEKPFSFTMKNINLPFLNIPCPGSEKNAAGNKRYFEIYGGPDYVFRSFSDTANSAYLQKRKESTRFSSAFSVGLRYTRVFNNAMSFRTGINFSQVNEKFKFVQGQMVQLVYIIDSNGDTTGSYATTGTRYKTTHNRYRTIDIPLTVGYEMGNGRLHTNINAGLVVNIYSWQKGDILDNAGQPINITTGKASSPYQFKTNVGLGFMGGASFYYKLTGNLHVLAEPYFRYNFSPANKAEITLKQKYTTAGLRLGLRIDF